MKPTRDPRDAARISIRKQGGVGLAGLASWGANAQSGITATKGVLKTLSSAANSLGVVKIVIEGGNLMASKIRTKEGQPWGEKLDNLQTFVQSEPNSPVYFAIFRDNKECLIVTYMPEMAKPGIKMLYSSTKNALKDAILDSDEGVQLQEFQVSEINELSFEEYTKREKREKPLTEHERMRMEEDNAETAGGYGLIAQMMKLQAKDGVSGQPVNPFGNYKPKAHKSTPDPNSGDQYAKPIALPGLANFTKAVPKSVKTRLEDENKAANEELAKGFYNKLSVNFGGNENMALLLRAEEEKKEAEEIKKQAAALKQQKLEEDERQAELEKKQAAELKKQAEEDAEEEEDEEEEEVVIVKDKKHESGVSEQEIEDILGKKGKVKETPVDIDSEDEEPDEAEAPAPAPVVQPRVERSPPPKEDVKEDSDSEEEEEPATPAAAPPTPEPVVEVDVPVEKPKEVDSDEENSDSDDEEDKPAAKPASFQPKEPQQRQQSVQIPLPKQQTFTPKTSDINRDAIEEGDINIVMNGKGRKQLEFPMIRQNSYEKGKDKIWGLFRSFADTTQTYIQKARGGALRDVDITPDYLNSLDDDNGQLSMADILRMKRDGYVGEYDINNMEQYLSDREFVQVFRMHKPAFNKLNKYKKLKLKRKAGL